MVKQFEVYLVPLDPTVGSEVKKTRPAVVVSPNEMNKYLQTVIIAPLTSTIKNYPSRVQATVKNKKGEIMLDQLRSVDKSRLTKKIEVISKTTAKKISEKLVIMFSL